jgi:tetratricopeptide (TPR) repeat protein
MRTLPWTLSWTLWLVASAARVSAQAPDPAPTIDAARENEGRRLFEQGMAAAEEARWADALPLFERSYARSGEAAALYNVATTLRALGRHADSSAAFDRLLEEHPSLDDARRADIVLLRDEERARTASLTLLDDPERVGELRLRIDARRIELTLPTTLRLDEGLHVVEAETDGHVDFHWEGNLRAGDAPEVRLALPLVPAAEVERPLRRSPALWVVVGLVVLGAVATTLALTLPADPLRPRDGTQVVRL